MRKRVDDALTLLVLIAIPTVFVTVAVVTHLLFFNFILR